MVFTISAVIAPLNENLWLKLDFRIYEGMFVYLMGRQTTKLPYSFEEVAAS